MTNIICSAETEGEHSRGVPENPAAINVSGGKILLR